MNYTLILVVFCVVSAAWCQDEEGEPIKPRPSGLLRRGALARNQAKTTTTTTTASPKEAPVEEYEDGEEELADEEAVEEQSTSTEASKKLKGGVRPFRSNDDLLAALKRRRAEAAYAHPHESPASTSSSSDSQPTADHSFSGNKHQNKRRFNASPKNEAQVEEASPAPAKAGRNRFSGRGLYKSNTADNGEIDGVESNQKSVEVKPKASYRPGQRRF